MNAHHEVGEGGANWEDHLSEKHIFDIALL
jgi:hypothetical protein